MGRTVTGRLAGGNALSYEANVSLWGITTFFDPTASVRRWDNYHRFREASARQGLKLLTVEQVFGDAAHRLRDGVDADIVVRKRASAVLWQKERLLNVALSALPGECDAVCWIDADVLFEDDEWVAQCEQLLRTHAVIQPFSAAIRLTATARVEDFPASRVGWTIREGTGDGTYSPSVAAKLSGWPSRFAGTTGYAWCARRELLDDVGFYDRCIVGGADREIALAVVFAPGAIPAAHTRIKHARLREHVARWHARIHPLTQGGLGVRKGVIHHLWHGASKSRNYVDRHQILIDHDFDPECDLSLDDERCWAWAPGREGLAAAVRAYFDARGDE